MAQGVPVAATAMGGLPELLGPDACTPAGDQAAFAERVAKLWHTAELRAAAGNSLLERAVRNHSLEAHARELRLLYERVAAAPAEPV